MGKKIPDEDRRSIGLDTSGKELFIYPSLFQKCNRGVTFLVYVAIRLKSSLRYLTYHIHVRNWLYLCIHHLHLYSGNISSLFGGTVVTREDDLSCL